MTSQRLAADGTTDFGTELRRRRTERGLSLAELAGVTHYSKTYLSKIENGHRVPTEDLARACDTALGADGALITLAAAADTAKRRVSQPVTVRPAQLPATTSSFTGRVRALQRLDAVLAADHHPAAPLAMLVGTAGCGKTALAVHWAHLTANRYPDGVIFVDLHGYSDVAARAATDVLADFLRALGAAPAAVPVDGDARAAMFRSLTAERRMLVVLDNAASSGQVLPLLPGTPTCHTLVTSRGNLPGLAVHGGVRIRLGPLPEADAVEVLRRTVGDTRLDAEPVAALALAHDCACLPLALRIAADWTAERPQLTLGQVVERLRSTSDRLDLLATDAPHSTLRSVFSWSYASLPDTAARAFRHLGLHPGADISLAAAAALLGCASEPARAALEMLSGVHLLTEKDSDRYEFHDLLREYAWERAEVDEPGSARSAAIDRVLRWYLLTARNGASRLSPGHRSYVCVTAPPDCHPRGFTAPADALAWFAAERANLVAAVGAARRSGRLDIAWQLAVNVSPFLYQHGHWDDWIGIQQIGLAAAEESGDDDAHARMLSGLGGAFGELRRYDVAMPYLERALAIRRRLNDRSGAAYVLANLATIERDSGQPDTAIQRLQEVEATFRADGDDFGLSYTLINVGELYLLRDEFGAARAALDEAVHLSRKRNNHFAEGWALHFLGRVRCRTDDLRGAELLLSDALAIRLDLGDQRGAAITLAHLAEVHDLAGQPGKADHCRRRARVLAEFLNDRDALEINAALVGRPRSDRSAESQRRDSQAPRATWPPR